MNNQLDSYLGTDLAPVDFETFWQRQKNEVGAVDPNVSLTKSAFANFHGFECYDMHFTGFDNSRIFAKCVRPTTFGSGKLPVILLFHGYGGNSGNYYDKLAFASQGFVVISMDARGQFGYSNDNCVYKGMTETGFVVRGLCENDPSKLYFHHLYCDVIQLLFALDQIDFVDADNVNVFGGSMGGALASVAAAMFPNKVKRAVISMPFLSDIGRLKTDYQFPQVYSDLNAYLRTYAMTEDEQTSIWKTLSYIDVKNFAPMISAETHFQIGTLDTTCPIYTTYAFYNNLRCKKQLKQFTNYGHEEFPTNVDSSIMFFRSGIEND